MRGLGPGGGDPGIQANRSAYCFYGTCPPRLITPGVRAGKACMDTRNYNTNSGRGIYTPASRRIYGEASEGAGEREEERLIMLGKVISSMGEIVRL